MIVKAEVGDRGKVPITVSITMTYSEWSALHTKLQSGGDWNYVSSDLAQHLRTILGKVSATFESQNLAD
jgi:hypothetical protein